LVVIEIDNRKIGSNYSTYIIAEAGVNHNGSLKTAYALVDAACESKADAVKFQTFKVNSLVLKGTPQADYQKRSREFKDQYNMLKSLEIKFEDFVKIKERCDKRKITFLSTPFDEESASFLNEIGVPAFKIGSGDFDNFLLLEKIVSFKKPVILSCGMSTMEEIDTTIKRVKKLGEKNIALLHCVSSYPCPYNQINLKVIPELQFRFNFPIGLSDHSIGIHIPVAAVALGAKIIEKHFTLDRSMAGPDHFCSLEPEEFRKMVTEIRDVEEALGKNSKNIQQCEKEILQKARKSIVAKVDIKKGDKITKEMVTAKRPRGGIPPSDIDKVVGRKALINIKCGTIIKWQMID